MPAVAALLASFVPPARYKLDLRTYDWQPEFTWEQRVVEANVAKTIVPATVIEGQRSFRTARHPRGDGPVLDVRSYDWHSEQGPEITVAANNVIRTWVPIWKVERDSFRTDERLRLDPRRYEWAPEDGWRYFATDRAFAPLLPPIRDELKSFRTDAAPLLDVRRPYWGPEDGWLQRTVDATVGTWAPIFDAEQSPRTPKEPVLDPRRYDWAPDDGWLYQPSSTTVATYAGIFRNELDSFRTIARPSLDVRRFEWSEFTWVEKVVEGTVSLWVPAFASQPLDLRKKASVVSSGTTLFVVVLTPAGTRLYRLTLLGAG